MISKHEHENERDTKPRSNPAPAAQHDAQAKLDEQREAAFKAEGERRTAEHEAEGKQREAARKYQDAVKKETERRAALSPPERVAEDEKRAAMTPEERAKDDESKGLTKPDLQDNEINQLAGTPQFTIFNEPHHAAEFVLTEANGQRSRENAYLADPVSVVVGQPLKKTAAATATQFATYVPAAVGADCDALALYAGGSNPTSGLRISVIARDAEVNGNLIVWGAITAPEQALGIARFATAGVIVRL
jgi:head decoration protein D